MTVKRDRAKTIPEEKLDDPPPFEAVKRRMAEIEEVLRGH